MPNFAALFKEEVRRLARREMRAQTGSLRRAAAQHRRDLASLKRLARRLAKSVEFLENQERARVARPQVSEKLAEKARFSPKWLKSHRARIKLSANDYGKLVGVSLQSVYQWEQGKAKPRKAQLAALVAIRGIGRREALRRLALIEAGKKAAKPARKRRRRAGRRRR
jgi:DNA-binding transcriptional regulator YiaG